MNLDKLFNPYIKPQTLYKGGKSKSEISVKTGKVYKLSSNENMMGTSPKAIEAVQKAVAGTFEYPDRTDIALREALSEFHGGALTPDQFLTGNSGSEIIEAIVRAFLGPDLEYIACNPMFKPYQMFANHVGAKMVDIPLVGARYELDVEGILAAINENTRLIFLISPNNPSGTIIPKDTLDSFIDSLPDHVVLVLDEVYWQYVSNEEYTRALPFVEANKAVIGINSFSKAYGMAGFRVGYAYTTPVLAEYIRRLQKPFQLNTFALHGAIAALGDIDFIARTKENNSREKARIYKAFDEIGVKYTPSEANFILVEPAIGENDFEAQMLENGIMVRTAGPFGAPGRVRITIGTSEANDAMIKAIKAVMAQNV